MPVKDDSLVAQYIRNIENPDSIGFRDGMWFQSPRKVDDPNNRGFGVDIRFNEAKELVKGRPGKYLTEEEERTLRNNYISSMEGVLNKWTPKVLQEIPSEVKKAMATGMLYRGDGVKSIIKDPALRDAYYSGTNEQFQEAVSNYYNSKGTKHYQPERAKQHNKFMDSHIQEGFNWDNSFKPTSSLFEKGGLLEPKDEWDKLSMAAKAEMMKVAVNHGIYDLQTIRQKYNEFTEGGSVSEEKEDTIVPFEQQTEVIITPDSEYNQYLNTLPDNQRFTPNDRYDSYLYWKLNDKPRNFREAVQRGMFTYDHSDNAYHANSIAFDEDTGIGYFMKPKDHDTVGYELDWFNKGLVTEKGGHQRPETPKEKAESDIFRHKYTLIDDPDRPNYYRYQPIEYASGGDIHIKPSHRGRLTELKKRTGKTEAELYRTGGPAVRKMITFARNSRKWKHGDGGQLIQNNYGNTFDDGGLFGNETVDTVASFLPILGTLEDGYQFLKDPSLANAGWLALSLGSDVLTGGMAARAIKALRLANKANDAARAANKAAKATWEASKKSRAAGQISGADNLRNIRALQSAGATRQAAIRRANDALFETGIATGADQGINIFQNAVQMDLLPNLAKEEAFGGNLFDGESQPTQKMQIGLDVQGWPDYTTQQIIAYGEENERRRKAIQDAYLNFVTESNDATSVANGRSQNQHLVDRAVRGAKANAAWEKEHPNLTTWGNTLATIPFIVASAPALDAAASTAMGQSVLSGINYIANAAKATPYISEVLPWAEAALATGSATHGIHEMKNGTFTPITTLEVSPLAPPVIGIGNNLYLPHLREHLYASKAPIGYDGILPAAKRMAEGILSGRRADIESPFWFNSESAKTLGESYAFVPTKIPEAEKAQYIKEFGQRALKARADMWRMYNRLPQKYNTFVENDRYPGAYTATEDIKALKWVPFPDKNVDPGDFVNSVGGNVGLPQITHLGKGLPDAGYTSKEFGITTLSDLWDLHPFSRPNDRLISRIQRGYQKAFNSTETPKLNWLKPLDKKLAKFEVGKLVNAKPIMVKNDIPWTMDRKLITDANGNLNFRTSYTQGFHSDNVLPQSVIDWKTGKPLIEETDIRFNPEDYNFLEMKLTTKSRKK